MFFSDRRIAGRRLGEALSKYRGREDVVVVGVPRGGVVVAAEVAKALDASLDIVVVKKLGYPGNPEFAMGAAGADDFYLNEEIVAQIPRGYVDEEIRLKQGEARGRVEMLRGETPQIDLHGKTVIVVDDGVATGASMIMAIKLLREKRPASIVVAVPVAPPDAVHALGAVADEVVALSQPVDFFAIGQFYGDFNQITDEEARRLLKEVNERRPNR